VDEQDLMSEVGT